MFLCFAGLRVVLVFLCWVVLFCFVLPICFGWVFLVVLFRAVVEVVCVFCLFLSRCGVWWVFSVGCLCFRLALVAGFGLMFRFLIFGFRALRLCGGFLCFLCVLSGLIVAF